MKWNCLVQAGCKEQSGIVSCTRYRVVESIVWVAEWRVL